MRTLRRIFLSVALCFISIPSFAQIPIWGVPTVVPGSYKTVFGSGYDCCGLDTTGKTSCGFSQAAPATAVLLIFGQSLYGNNVNLVYTPWNTTKICNYNPYDGNLYADGVRLLGPLVDAPTGTCVNPDGSQCRDNIARYIADWLLFQTKPDGSPKFQHVIIVSIPIGGSQIGPWAAGGVYAPHMAGVVQNLVAHSLIPTAVLLGIGESDNLAGTSQADFYNQASSAIQNARSAGLPQTVPWFIARETLLITGAAPQIQAAQAQLVDHANNIWAGADFDGSIQFNSSYRLVPSPHLNQAGAVAGMVAWVTALTAYGPPF